MSGRCATPDTGCSGYTNLGGDWRVLMPPIELFYHGFTCDRILFLARMCADRAVDLMGEGSLDEALVLWQTASRIARYALVIIAHMGASLVHEVGHVYLGYGHCSNGKNCCFSAAALVWLCRVRARLGLPREKLEPDPAGDYNGEHRLQFGYRRCGSGDDYAFLCDVSAEGVVGQSATVLATTCRSSEEFTNGCS